MYAFVTELSLFHIDKELFHLDKKKKKKEETLNKQTNANNNFSEHSVAVKHPIAFIRFLRFHSRGI